MALASGIGIGAAVSFFYNYIVGPTEAEHEVVSSPSGRKVKRSRRKSKSGKRSSKNESMPSPMISGLLWSVSIIIFVILCFCVLKGLCSKRRHLVNDNQVPLDEIVIENVDDELSEEVIRDARREAYEQFHRNKRRRMKFG